MGDAAAVGLYTLAVDTRAAEVIARFEAHGIPSLLLKGRGLARWLYPDDDRFYNDVDLLVPAADYARAGTVLEAHGYRRSRFPSPSHHAYCYTRAGDQVEAVDLHRTYHLMEADPEVVWDRLWRDAETLELPGGRARIPARPLQALSVVLHAVIHGLGPARLDEDLRRVLASEVDWDIVRAHADALGALVGLAAGLQAHAEGRAIAARLGLDGAVPDALRLQLTTPPATAHGFLRLAGAAPRARWRLVARELVPPREQMRKHVPLARRGAIGLALSYAARPLWLARRAPAGWRAAQRIRSQTTAAPASGSPSRARSST